MPDSECRTDAEKSKTESTNQFVGSSELASSDRVKYVMKKRAIKSILSSELENLEFEVSL
jgi:hypothetical protein